MPVSQNDYYFLRRGEIPLRLDIHGPERDPSPDVCLSYWLRVFRNMEESSGLRGRTFYVVWNTDPVHELPTYGDDVIVLLLMDEFCLVPPYLGKVGFVFKTHGFGIYPAGMLRDRTVAGLAKLLRDGVLWTARMADFLLLNAGSMYSDRKMVVPLGYGRQADVPSRPFAERRYLISFHGSIEQRPYRRLSVRSLLRTPKGIARARMARSLRKIAEKIPGGRIHFATTGSFQESITTDGTAYAEVMADTVICLAPRGSSVETFRLFEAMRHGCVVVCDRQPPHWFYRDCPVVEIDDWLDLEAVLQPLLADPQRLLDLHRRSLRWWEDVGSERAVGLAMSRRLARAGTAAVPLGGGMVVAAVQRSRNARDT
jgi:hypothetical protein